MVSAKAGLPPQQLYEKTGEDNLSISDWYATAAELRLNIVKNILSPLAEYQQAGESDPTIGAEPLQNLKWIEIREKLAESQEEAIVFVRKHFKHCRGLEKHKHPRLGNLSAREWLCLLPEIEKRITKIILQKKFD